jgi:hypothetical protein
MISYDEVKARIEAEKRSKETMQPGVRYQITFEDSRVSGKFIGVFQGWDYPLGESEVDEEHPSPLFKPVEEAIAVFDIGRIGPLWGEWTVEPMVPYEQGIWVNETPTVTSEQVERLLTADPEAEMPIGLPPR